VLLLETAASSLSIVGCHSHTHRFHTQGLQKVLKTKPGTLSEMLFIHQPSFSALLVLASCVCLFYKHVTCFLQWKYETHIAPRGFKRCVRFVSKYCLSNNGAIPQKQQSSCFSSPSLCRTKHQVPQKSALLFCCCIRSCHPATGACGRDPPYWSKQFKRRAGLLQFNLTCQASVYYKHSCNVCC